MRLIDKIAIGRAIKMLLDFILALISKFQPNTNNKETETKKKKRRWRRNDE